jgi:hypothetical protein
MHARERTRALNAGVAEGLLELDGTFAREFITTAGFQILNLCGSPPVWMQYNNDRRQIASSTIQLQNAINQELV